MDIKRLDAEISVAAQITAAEVPETAAAGFKAIICIRPDGEGNHPHSHKAIDDARGYAQHLITLMRHEAPAAP